MENALLSFDPFNMGASPHSPHSQGAFAVDFDASLALLHDFAVSWDTGAFNLCGELVYHRRNSGVGDPVLGERERQETTRNLIWGVDKHTPAHRTFDVFVPPPACPMKSGEEMLDHAKCAEGMTAVWVGDSNGMGAK